MKRSAGLLKNSYSCIYTYIHTHTHVAIRCLAVRLCECVNCQGALFWARKRVGKECKRAGWDTQALAQVLSPLAYRTTAAATVEKVAVVVVVVFVFVVVVVVVAVVVILLLALSVDTHLCLQY